MKRFLPRISLAALLLCSIIAVASCQSTAQAVQEPRSVPEPQGKTASVPAEAEPPAPGQLAQAHASSYGALVLDGAQAYTVRWGDTLSSVARRYYGRKNGYFFPLILLASRDVVADPDYIRGGMVLTIPRLSANVEDKAVARQLSPYFAEVADLYAERSTRTSAKTQRRLRELSETLAR